MATSKDEFIASLQNEINHLRAKIAKLEEENQLLKNALTGQTLEAEKTYRQLETHFDRLSNQILQVVVYLTKLHQRPVSYEEIIKCFRARYPFIDAKTETITRRVRELAEIGNPNRVLHSPKRGYFTPIPASKVNVQ
jgi:chromosome segregation ATPase